MENKLEEIKISVIVPVYNQREDYLDECVSSICNQTYKNLEIILVDDGSLEACSQLCDKYCLKDNRIKVIHKENGGTASARRVGIQEASGDYVAFVDSDDWIETDIYNKAIAILDDNKADMASFGYYRSYDNGVSMKVSNYNKVLYCERENLKKEVFPYFIKTDVFFDTDLPLSGCCYLYRADLARVVAQKINDEIKTGDDYLFVWLAILNAESFCLLPYIGYHYRSNVNSKTHFLKNIKKLQCGTYKAIDNAINEACYDKYSKDNLKKKNILIAFHSIMLKDYSVLMEDRTDFLFPYTQVRRGSKILIYGAGKLGQQIYSSVRSDMNYEVVGMADKNWRSYQKQGVEVIAPEDILGLDYDYVIIAITYAAIRSQAKQYLMELGILADKIAEIDLSVLDGEHLPFSESIGML